MPIPGESLNFIVNGIQSGICNYNGREGACMEQDTRAKAGPLSSRYQANLRLRRMYFLFLKGHFRKSTPKMPLRLKDLQPRKHSASSKNSCRDSLHMASTCRIRPQATLSGSVKTVMGSSHLYKNAMIIISLDTVRDLQLSYFYLSLTNLNSRDTEPRKDAFHLTVEHPDSSVLGAMASF